MKKVVLLVVLSLAWLSVSAQALVPITWTAYGLTLEAPKGILVEEDTEETFLLNNSKFYITIQSLDSDGIDVYKRQAMLRVEMLMRNICMESWPSVEFQL